MTKSSWVIPVCLYGNRDMRTNDGLIITSVQTCHVAHTQKNPFDILIRDNICSINPSPWIPWNRSAKKKSGYSRNSRHVCLKRRKLGTNKLTLNALHSIVSLFLQAYAWWWSIMPKKKQNYGHKILKAACMMLTVLKSPPELGEEESVMLSNLMQG